MYRIPSRPSFPKIVFATILFKQNFNNQASIYNYRQHKFDTRQILPNQLPRLTLMSSTLRNLALMNTFNYQNYQKSLKQYVLCFRKFVSKRI